MATKNKPLPGIIVWTAQQIRKDGPRNFPYTRLSGGPLFYEDDSVVVQAYRQHYGNKGATFKGWEKRVKLSH